MEHIQLQSHSFDFNEEDRAFVARHFGTNLPKEMAEITESLRVWLRDRSYGGTVHIDTDFSKTANAEQEIYSVNVKGITVLGIVFTKIPTTYVASACTPQEALESLVDTTTAYNEHERFGNLGILHSLRPVLRDAFNKAPAVSKGVVGGDTYWQMISNGKEGSYYVTVDLNFSNHIVQD